METNKLSQITQKLYEEGLSKGRSEGERIVADAEARAKEIVAKAEEKAGRIAQKAAADAEELRKNTLTEISLAGREAVAKIKDEIAGLIVARSIEGGVHKAGIDPAFIKETLIEVAKNWRGNSADKVTLVALLPESRQKELDAAFAASASALLAEGIEVGYSRDVRSGFKVGEKNGGYYIGFSDENFEALLGGYLREKVATILYGAK
jgi:V/A-type H+-transporting ATPase subunit E